MQPSQDQPVEDSFEKCVECGYEGGFHCLLQRIDEDEQERNMELYLKCPNCATTYRVGWLSRLKD